MAVLIVVLLAAPWLAQAPVTSPVPAPDPAAQTENESQEAPPLRIGRGPWNEDLVLLSSEEGSRWDFVGVLVEHAGAPSACRLADGRLLVVFQWFSADLPEEFGRLAFVVSEDEGQTWSEPRTATIEGMTESMRSPFDPHVVALEDGSLRMYFSSHLVPRAHGGGYESGTRPATWSAVSPDGESWTFEPGRRFGVEGQPVLDPTVVRFRGEWHYFAPIEGRSGAAFHAVSQDGLAFHRWPEVEAEDSDHWLGCVLAESEHGESDALLRFYGSGRVGWSAVSRDARDWRLDGRVVWGPGSDPAVVVLQEGGRLMIASAPGAAQSEAENALLAAMSGGPTAAMTANDRYLYVLRGETIYMFEASTLRFLRMKRLPALEQGDDESPAQGDLPGEAGVLRRGDRSGG